MKGDGHSTCEHHCHNATETGFCDIAQNQKNTQKDLSAGLWGYFLFRIIEYAEHINIAWSGYFLYEWLYFHFLLSCIGEGNGNPLQCSCLENPWDGGAWWAAVYGVTQSRTRPKWLSSSSRRELALAFSSFKRLLHCLTQLHSFNICFSIILLWVWSSFPPLMRILLWAYPDTSRKFFPSEDA